MELLKVSVGILWLINLGLLIWYMVEQEVNGWNVTALVGVALTGIVPIGVALPRIVPMLFGYETLVKKREGWATFVHVISGVIGTAGSGLALGYAAQCGKSSYANIELLVAAAVVNGLSGIVAHFAFIDNDEQKKIYENESLAYSCCCSRGFWYLLFLAVATLISLLTAVWNHDNEYKNKCDNEDHYSLYFISPITHLVGSILLVLFSPQVPPILNFTIMFTAAILSMFGLNLTYGWGGDWAIVIPVYLYLTMAHVKFTSS